MKVLVIATPFDMTEEQETIVSKGIVESFIAAGFEGNTMSISVFSERDLMKMAVKNALDQKTVIKKVTIFDNLDKVCKEINRLLNKSPHKNFTDSTAKLYSVLLREPVVIPSSVRDLLSWRASVNTSRISNDLKEKAKHVDVILSEHSLMALPEVIIKIQMQ